MNNLVNIMSMVGTEKTLIIACGEYGLNKYVECNDRIFIYALPENTLQEYDPLEKGRIQYFVESRACTQVVIVGSVEKHLVQRLISNESNRSPAALLKFNLKVFLRKRDVEILPNWLRNQILVEQHIINQCNLLMDYFFIRDRVENKQLQIKGFVIDQKEENLKPIFNNRIIYNDIISMN
jgi:carbonic anhydrase